MLGIEDKKKEAGPAVGQTRLSLPMQPIRAALSRRASNRPRRGSNRRHNRRSPNPNRIHDRNGNHDRSRGNHDSRDTRDRRSV